MIELPEEDFETRSARLTAEIARQRGELVVAYRSLEKPIHYAEYGLRGFGFLRANPWIFAAVPAVFSIASTLLGMRKRKVSRSEPSQHQIIEHRPKGFKNTVVVLGRGALQLYQLYRRVRSFIP